MIFGHLLELRLCALCRVESLSKHERVRCLKFMRSHLFIIRLEINYKKIESITSIFLRILKDIHKLSKLSLHQIEFILNVADGKCLHYLIFKTKFESQIYPNIHGLNKALLEERSNLSYKTREV